MKVVKSSGELSDVVDLVKSIFLASVPLVFFEALVHVGVANELHSLLVAIAVDIIHPLVSFFEFFYIRRRRFVNCWLLLRSGVLFLLVMRFLLLDAGYTPVYSFVPVDQFFELLSLGD